MANAGRYNCRISLNDFIGPNEEIIITAMKMATDKVNRRLFFILWFKPEIVSDSKVKQFYSDHEQTLQYIGTRLINRRGFEVLLQKSCRIFPFLWAPIREKFWSKKWFFLF